MKIYPVILELNLTLPWSGQEAADVFQADLMGADLQEGVRCDDEILILFKPMGWLHPKAKWSSSSWDIYSQMKGEPGSAAEPFTVTRHPRW